MVGVSYICSAQCVSCLIFHSGRTIRGRKRGCTGKTNCCEHHWHCNTQRWWQCRSTKAYQLKTHFSKLAELLFPLIKWTSTYLYDLVSFLSQKSSWRQFCITSHTFKILLASHRVFVPFLDFVQAYGVKRDEDSYKWRGCRWNFSPKPSSTGDPEIYGKNFILLVCIN